LLKWEEKKGKIGQIFIKSKCYPVISVLYGFFFPQKKHPRDLGEMSSVGVRLPSRWSTMHHCIHILPGTRVKGDKGHVVHPGFSFSVGGRHHGG
jgi:hypothetical protein